MLNTTDITEPEIEKLTILDVPFWIDRDRGRLIPVVRGGADGDGGTGDGGTGGDGGAGSGAGDGDGGGGGGTPKTFTQAEVDRMMGRTRSEAAKAARTEIETFLASEKTKTDNATLDDAARTKAEADQAKAEAETARADAARERFEAKVERKLGAAGVPDAAIARAVRLVTLEADASDDDITAEIETLKTDVPGLFTSTTEGEEGKAGNGGGAPSGVTGGKPPAGGQGQKTPLEKGAERYHAKKKPAQATTAA